jgi:hypothetical protein
MQLLIASFSLQPETTEIITIGIQRSGIAAKQLSVNKAYIVKPMWLGRVREFEKAVKNY